MKRFMFRLLTFSLVVFTTGGGVSAGERVKGLGDVTEWSFLTAWEIQQRLPERFALITTTKPIPEGWPADIRGIALGDQSVPGTVTWRWNPDGKAWRTFYTYGYEVPVRDALPERAFVYERQEKTHGTTYVPVVVLEFDHDGVCESASQKLCKQMLKKSARLKQRR